MDVDPAVAKLLDLKTGDETLPDFVNRLEAIAQKQGWQPQYTECKKRALSDWDEARAVLIRSGQTPYVAVLLKSWTHTVPGKDVQTAVLLDHRGKFLDHLACEINSRLTRMHSGQLHTVIPGNPEADGAQFVIRLDGASARGNFAHQVYHRGNKAVFYWGHGHLPAVRPTKWDTKGLCRIAVMGRKFQVLFPGEKDKEPRPVP